MMKTIRNEKGVALIIVLLLSAVALIVVGGLAFMIAQSTRMSGSSKRYRTAADAGQAGINIVTQVLDARGANPGIPLPNFVVAATLPTKLNLATANWPAGTDSSLTIDPAIATTYDVRFDLGVNPTYTVYAKVADTIVGNTSSGSGKTLHKHGVVANAGSSEIIVVPYPYVYSVEVLAQDAANPNERAKFSMLYQF